MAKVPQKIGLVALSILLVSGLLVIATVAGQTSKVIRIIYTNDTLGYIEPCGCGGHRSGGLARRAVLISQLRKENPHSVIVESGNLTNTPDRLGLIAAILAEIGYDAVGVGETDIRTCGEEFYKKAAEAKLTVIDASPGAPKSAVPYLVKTVDGIRVGIVSFGYGLRMSEQDDYERRKTLYAAYSEARRKSDILIVLDQSNTVTREWIESNEKRFGAPDIVIGGVMRRTMMQEDVIGKTHIVPTSIQGRDVGIVDIEIAPGELPKYAVRKVPLDDNVPEDTTVKKRVEEFMGKVGQASAYSAARSATTEPHVTVGQSSAKYYPPLLCKACHTAEYEQWERTKHARAVATLTAQQRAIPECLKCHSEMFRRLQRLTLTSGAPAGVDCMTCHEKSLPHGLERKDVATRVKVDTKICLECHDKEWSPNYNEKTYLAKITHGSASSSGSVAATPQPTVQPTPGAQNSATDSRPPAPPPPTAPPGK